MALPVPVITHIEVYWDATAPGYADLEVFWELDHGSFPEGNVEVFRWEEDPPDLLATSPSSAGSYYLQCASMGGEVLYFQVRYMYEDAGVPVVGEMSPLSSISI